MEKPVLSYATCPSLTRVLHVAHCGQLFLCLLNRDNFVKNQNALQNVTKMRKVPSQWFNTGYVSTIVYRLVVTFRCQNFFRYVFVLSAPEFRDWHCIERNADEGRPTVALSLVAIIQTLGAV